jgi:hypothetical protein
MQRNEHMERVAEVFLGHWDLEITNMWWEPETVGTGSAVVEWLGDSFLRLQAELNGAPSWDFVFGRSDANERFVVLYHDERGVMREFELTFEDDGSWELRREDPDFHQTLGARIDGDRMVGDTRAREDDGTWRKDFDLVWTRTT